MGTSDHWTEKWTGAVHWTMEWTWDVQLQHGGTIALYVRD